MSSLAFDPDFRMEDLETVLQPGTITGCGSRATVQRCQIEGS
ncbi:MAG: hypothetical protein ACXWZG_06835 [Microbacterium sp.]